jgi:hypothetical protein
MSATFKGGRQRGRGLEMLRICEAVRFPDLDIFENGLIGWLFQSRTLFGSESPMTIIPMIAGHLWIIADIAMRSIWNLSC